MNEDPHAKTQISDGYDDEGGHLYPDRDYIPGQILTPETRTKICEELLRRFEFVLSPSLDDWNRLEHVLCRYEVIAHDWSGYLNLTQSSVLAKVKLRSGKLLDALSRSKDLECLWAIEMDLPNVDMEQFCETLKKIQLMDFNSPKLDPKTCETVNNHLRDASGELQVEIDNWWKTVVGTSRAGVEGEDDPYSIFLLRIANRLSGPQLGRSRTQMKERRKIVRAAQKKAEFRSKKMMEAFDRLTKVARPGAHE